MKVAISASGENLDDNIAELFGRCPYFILAEIEDGKIGKTEALKNDSADQASGAGMAAAQLLAEKGVAVVIAGNVGPRALDVLNQFDIKVHSASGRIKENLENFIKKAGK